MPELATRAIGEIFLVKKLVNRYTVAGLLVFFFVASAFLGFFASASVKADSDVTVVSESTNIFYHDSDEAIKAPVIVIEETADEVTETESEGEVTAEAATEATINVNTEPVAPAAPAQTQETVPEPVVAAEPASVSSVTYSSGRYSGVTISDYEKSLIAKIVYHEANNQCQEGKQAVAEVVLNRLISSVFPQYSVESVLFAPGQFTSYAELSYIVPTDACYRAVESALTGPNVIESNVFFFANAWGKGPLDANYIFSCQIGDHYFYAI